MEFSHISSQMKPAGSCALQQHASYGDALRLLGVRVHKLNCKEKDQELAHVQVIERKFGPIYLRWLPRGPVWVTGTTPQQKRNLLATLPYQFSKQACWISTPDSAADTIHFANRGNITVLTPQHVAEIDLTKSRGIRLADQCGKWRNRLRRAERSDIQINHRQLDLTKDEPLLNLELTQRRTNRYSALPLAFTQAWSTATTKATQLFTANASGKIVAYLLVLLHQPVATYHIGWSGAEGRLKSAHSLLIWRASNWLADNGFERFDLGNVDTQYAPGLARFKIGSGANVRPLGPSLLRLPTPKFLMPKRHAAA